MRFFVSILFPVSWDTGQAERNVRLSSRTFLSPVLWEEVCERKRKRAALRAAHSLSFLVGGGTREEDSMCGS